MEQTLIVEHEVRYNEYEWRAHTRSPRFTFSLSSSHKTEPSRGNRTRYDMKLEQLSPDSGIPPEVLFKQSDGDLVNHIRRVRRPRFNRCKQETFCNSSGHNTQGHRLAFFDAQLLVDNFQQLRIDSSCIDVLSPICEAQGTEDCSSRELVLEKP